MAKRPPTNYVTLEELINGFLWLGVNIYRGKINVKI